MILYAVHNRVRESPGYLQSVVLERIDIIYCNLYTYSISYRISGEPHVKRAPWPPKRRAGPGARWSWRCTVHVALAQSTEYATDCTLCTLIIVVSRAVSTVLTELGTLEVQCTQISRLCARESLVSSALL